MTFFLDKAPDVDLNTVEIVLPHAAVADRRRPSSPTTAELRRPRRQPPSAAAAELQLAATASKAKGPDASRPGLIASSGCVRAYSFPARCWHLMKVSKLYSATWFHR